MEGSTLRTIPGRGLLAMRQAVARSGQVMRSPLVAYRRAQARRTAPVRTALAGDGTQVDSYWGRHTVKSRPFATAGGSQRYLEWRFEQYPLFRELAGMWGDHSGQTILDYGCGPANDVTGYLLYSGADRVIGVDISEKALEVARARVALHKVDPARYELIRISDGAPRIPLDDGTVDFVSCQGVIQHVSDPAAVLAELRRVLAPGGTGKLMVYNRDSVWLHLYTAYVKQVLEERWPGMPVEEAFQRNTDGEDCPIARCYRPEEFEALCRGAGFAEAGFEGGYLSLHELELLDEHRDAAIADERLAPEHRAFLEELTQDAEGRPQWRGRYAGVGGVYSLRA